MDRGAVVGAGARSFCATFSRFTCRPAYGAAELREGRVPAFFESWALGVPYRGNPRRWRSIRKPLLPDAAL
jgi:hypothetical protein